MVPGQIRSTNQPWGAMLLDTYVVLCFLAPHNAHHGRVHELVLIDVWSSDHVCSGILLLQSETRLHWTGGVGQTRRVSRKTVVRLQRWPLTTCDSEILMWTSAYTEEHLTKALSPCLESET